MGSEGDGQTCGWGVVEVRSNSEARAEQSLIDLGYQPLVVRYNKLIRGARVDGGGRRVRSRADSIEPRPFIPGYLFLPIPHSDDATLVDGARGVKRLFRQRDQQGYLGRPKVIRARIVDQIVAAALLKDETPKQARDDLKSRIADDGEVRVRSPENGMVLTLTSLDDKGRAEYFTMMMGVERRGSIEDTSTLELVDA